MDVESRLSLFSLEQNFTFFKTLPFFLYQIRQHQFSFFTACFFNVSPFWVPSSGPSPAAPHFSCVHKCTRRSRWRLTSAEWSTLHLHRQPRVAFPIFALAQHYRLLFDLWSRKPAKYFPTELLWKQFLAVLCFCSSSFLSKCSFYSYWMLPTFFRSYLQFIKLTEF